MSSGTNALYLGDMLDAARRGTPGWEFFGTLPDELSAILGGHKIDLGTFRSLSRWIKDDVMSEAVDEYVEA